jgi:4-amino-4-deoxy-L-arabinose transferase-like glycosyltransferase
LTLQSLRNEHRWLIISLVVAILLRLIFILILDPNPNLRGGDVNFYFERGPLLIRNMAEDVSPAPIFLIYVGVVQLFTGSGANAILTVRLLNIIWHCILIVSVYTLGNRYFNRSTAIVAAFVIAINPIFIIEAGYPITESVYLPLLFGTLAIYSQWQDAPSFRQILLIGLLLGITTETRAVLLAFPVVLIAHQIRLQGWKRGLQLGAAMLLTFSLVLSLWTVYSAVRFKRFVIGAEGIIGFAWMGINGQQAPRDVSQAAGNPETSAEFNNNLAGQVGDTIAKNLPGYISTRVKNFASAFLQPHNTVYFAGDSLKTIAGKWLREDRSIGGLIALTQSDKFWPKLLLYVFHFWALVFGIVGMIINWRKFWFALPLFGYILYTSAVHTVLLALPRYLFPMQPSLILFASAATLALVAQLRKSPRTATSSEPMQSLESV